MVNTKSIHITCLDSGFILEENKQSKAVEFSSSIEKLLTEKLLGMVKGMNHIGTKSISIRIEVEVNPAICV